jgi:hypothetical protein
VVQRISDALNSVKPVSSSRIHLLGIASSATSATCASRRRSTSSNCCQARRDVGYSDPYVAGDARRPGDGVDRSGGGVGRPDCGHLQDHTVFDYDTWSRRRPVVDTRNALRTSPGIFGSGLSESCEAGSRAASFTPAARG